MSSLIRQLQADAIDRTISVSDLLRRAKIVAVRLDLHEFHEWIEKELDGYDKKDKVPSYRLITGEAQSFNPYHGWHRITFEDVDAEEIFSEMPIGQSLGELEEIMRGESGRSLSVPYPADVQKDLLDAIPYSTNIRFMCDLSSVARIISGVRNVILEWSLKLEKAGILGEGTSFSQEDKDKAHEPQIVFQIGNIDNFTGVIGAVSDQATVSIKQINEIDIEELCDLVKQITKHMGDICLDSQEKDTLQGIIKDIKHELEGKAPEPSKIRGLLNSVKTIMENAAGNIVAKGILLGIKQLLG